MSTTSPLPDVGIELREGYAEVGDQRLHYVDAGEGPLVVLLHGFPEFWFGWRLQIAPLVAAGFRVVAPDTRGYNLSSKPEGFEAYAVDLLAADIRDLIGERGANSALLVGHDWGGSIAWTTAMNHPEVVDRLAILNEGNLVALGTPTELKNEIGGDVVLLDARSRVRFEQAALVAEAQGWSLPPEIDQAIAVWRFDAA